MPQVKAAGLIVERLQAMLRGNGHAANVHDIVLALGILLEPVMSSGSSQLDRGLALPLPDDPLYINLVASYWMTLIAPFLEPRGAVGRPRKTDMRDVWDAIQYFAAAGCAWRLAQQGGGTDTVMIDATHLKAHRTASSLGLKRGATAV